MLGTTHTWYEGITQPRRMSKNKVTRLKFGWERPGRYELNNNEFVWVMILHDYKIFGYSRLLGWAYNDNKS